MAGVRLHSAARRGARRRRRGKPLRRALDPRRGTSAAGGATWGDALLSIAALPLSAFGLCCVPSVFEGKSPEFFSLIMPAPGRCPPAAPASAVPLSAAWRSPGRVWARIQPPVPVGARHKNLLLVVTAGHLGALIIRLLFDTLHWSSPLTFGSLVSPWGGASAAGGRGVRVGAMHQGAIGRGHISAGGA